LDERRIEGALAAESPDSAAPTPVFFGSNRETDETYRGVVAVLNAKLRVVAGSCGLQWVIQKRRNQFVWSSVAFCGTREGLMRNLPAGGQGCDPEAWAVIEALP
jgi:hypothetical protein